MYDLGTSILTFFHITDARVNDMNDRDVIPYEEDSFYIFDRGFNDTERLSRINVSGAYFIVRGKKDKVFKPSPGGRSDDSEYMNSARAGWKYPKKIIRINYWSGERRREPIFFINVLELSQIMLA